MAAAMTYRLNERRPHRGRQIFVMLYWMIVLVSFIGDVYIANYIGLFR